MANSASCDWFTFYHFHHLFVCYDCHEEFCYIQRFVSFLKFKLQFYFELMVKKNYCSKSADISQRVPSKISSKSMMITTPQPVLKGHPGVSL